MSSLFKEILDSSIPHVIEKDSNEYLEDEAKRREEFHRTMGDEKVEFIEGEIILSGPEYNKHSIIFMNLTMVFGQYLRKIKLGHVYGQKIMVSLKRNDFCPDLSFFRKEVTDTFVDDTLFFPVPDFVVEVLSTSTAKRDRGIKFVDYALNGVKEYWIVDPDKKIVEQYFLEGEVFTLAEKISYATVKCGQIKGLEIPLEAIFDETANDEFLLKM